MKNMKTNLFLSLVVIAIALIWTSCEKNNEATIKINEFKVVPQSYTAPAQVLITSKITTLGLVKTRYISVGAYSSLINGTPRDTSEYSVTMSTRDVTNFDTLRLYYLSAGKYDVILETNGNKHTETFTLQ